MGNFDTSSAYCFGEIRSEILNSFQNSSGIFCVDSYGVETEYHEFFKLINNFRNAFSFTNKKIAILAEKNATHYAALLATVFSGNTWVPVSLEMPTNRNLDILKSVKADILLTSKKLNKNQFKKFEQSVRTIMFFEDFDDSVVDCTKLWPKIENNNIAIIFHTSGSSGKPKGVKTSFLNLAAALRNTTVIFAKRNLVWGDYHDLSFVISINILFTCLVSRGRIFCANSRYDQISPAKSISQNRVSCLVTVPSTLSRIALDKKFNNIFKTLRVVASCGEPLSLDLLKKFFCRRELEIHNFYGSTEVTTWVFHHQCKYNDLKKFGSYGFAPLGSVVQGNQFHISNEGLLMISGPQVTAGYIELPKTSHLRQIGGEQWFSMGDIVEKMEGKIICKGRADSQIKLNGYRINLMDIESHLRTISGVDSAICYLSDFGATASKIERRITAVLFTKKKFSLESVRTHLIDKLPSYMLPRQLFCIERMPTNKNGKIDRINMIEKLEKRALE